MENHQKKGKEMIVNFLRNENVIFFLFPSIIVIYLIMIFLLTVCNPKIYFVIWTIYFMIAIGGILLFDASDVLQHTELKKIQKNPIHYILLSHRSFTNHAIAWGVGFPIFYTILNVIQVFLCSQSDASSILFAQKLSNSDFVFILAIIFASISRFTITPRINEHYKKLLQ